VGVIAAGLGSLVGMSLAIIAHTAIMEERPARGIGVAFILLQAASAVKFLMLVADEVELTNRIFVRLCGLRCGVGSISIAAPLSDDRLSQLIVCGGQESWDRRGSLSSRSRYL